MREDRAAFVEFFGGDELVLPPGEAEERLNAYYRHRQEAALALQPARRGPQNLPGMDAPVFEFPPELADAETTGIIYDETDGLNCYNEYARPKPCWARVAPNGCLRTGRWPAAASGLHPDFSLPLSCPLVLRQHCVRGGMGSAPAGESLAAIADMAFGHPA